MRGPTYMSKEEFIKLRQTGWLWEMFPNLTTARYEDFIVAYPQYKEQTQ